MDPLNGAEISGAVHGSGWRSVLNGLSTMVSVSSTREAGSLAARIVDGPEPPGLVDPRGQGPAIWFQQMTEPRPQRNRIHLDVSVPHDEAPHRIEAALAA
ncbi:hypothetical protein GCM10027445_66580 [Amycolatopsis endophytica]|uniref:Glyoxalase-like domain-containing protein n=1 Tax=Amycolatopsis endophytica TaxID=860233 RepID=A0A853B3M6_9PSEU|nr:VOC family protein [Amycolatopsis endophytica]NYI89763.1 hypothetical protein [Amycolatopsis endophytica]